MPDPGSYNSQMVSAMLAANSNGPPSKGAFGGMIPNADVSGGVQLMILGIGKNPLNTTFAAFLNGGGFGRKPGQQALIAKIGAEISANFAKANQDGQAYRQMLAADVQQSAIQSGLPRDLGTGGNGSGGRSV